MSAAVACLYHAPLSTAVDTCHLRKALVMPMDLSARVSSFP